MWVLYVFNLVEAAGSTARFCDGTLHCRHCTECIKILQRDRRNLTSYKHTHTHTDKEIYTCIYYVVYIIHLIYRPNSKHTPVIGN